MLKNNFGSATNKMVISKDFNTEITRQAFSGKSAQTDRFPHALNRPVCDGFGPFRTLF